MASLVWLLLCYSLLFACILYAFNFPLCAYHVPYLDADLKML
jgi:hypothetical protein